MTSMPTGLNRFSVIRPGPSRAGSAISRSKSEGHPANPRTVRFISARSHYPPAWPRWNWQVIDLDTGREVDRVVECDAVGGYVITHVRGPEGQLVLNEDKTEVVTEIRHGRFEIRRLGSRMSWWSYVQMAYLDPWYLRVASRIAGVTRKFPGRG